MSRSQQQLGELEGQVDTWFAAAKDKAETQQSRTRPKPPPMSSRANSTVDPSSYPTPPAQSRRDNRSRSKIFSIHFDNPTSLNDSTHEPMPKQNYKNRMSMRIAPSFHEAQQMEVKSTSKDYTDYGTGITTTFSPVPFYRQPRQIAYLILLLSAMVAFSLQSNINIRFGGTIIQNGRWNSLLIHANWFVTSLVITSCYALAMMVWYYFKKPSLPKIPYAFLASSVLWMAIFDVTMHFLMFVSVFGMTIDVGVKFKSCYAQATKFNYQNKSSCVFIQWAVGLAALTVAILVGLVGVRIMELRKIGFLGGKRK